MQHTKLFIPSINGSSTIFEIINNPVNIEHSDIIHLYVKQHSVTKLLYFGKTVAQDPIKYPGSGTYWQRHIKKHGQNFVKTLYVWTFNYQPDATKFALQFSEDNDIVKSKSWANLRPENGLDGHPMGSEISEETRKKISEANIGKPKSDEHRRKLKERVHTEETKILMRKPKSEKHRINMGIGQKHRSGRKWWNNGIKTKFCQMCPGNNWTLGRLIND